MHVTKCIDDEHERQRSYVRVHGKPSVLNGQPILKALLESRGLEEGGHQLGGHQHGYYTASARLGHSTCKNRAQHVQD